MLSIFSDLGVASPYICVKGYLFLGKLVPKEISFYFILAKKINE